MNPPQRKLNLEIPSNLSAVYSNAVMVSQTNTEIVLDFLQIMPNDPRARIQSRIVMTPTGAKAFLKALSQNLERYEERHGEIDVPPSPATLADQLFGSVRPEDSGNE
jgi:hypothetical protein